MESQKALGICMLFTFFFSLIVFGIVNKIGFLIIQRFEATIISFGFALVVAPSVWLLFTNWRLK